MLINYLPRIMPESQLNNPEVFIFFKRQEQYAEPGTPARAENSIFMLWKPKRLTYTLLTNYLAEQREGELHWY
jgi:hypothetical protein